MQQNGILPILPPELLNNDPNGFAWGVWHDRTPKLVNQIRDAHPYGPDERCALDTLLDEIASGPMQPLRPQAHDYNTWADWGTDYLGKPWLDAPFLWSESYFYRRLLDASGFFEGGPWHWVDPFEPMKAAELRDPALERDLAALRDLQHLPVAEQGRTKLLASLWGNQADLGFKIGAGADDIRAAPSGLITDQSTEIWSRLDERADVVLVLDNAGRELLADLVLADHLLEHQLARTVALHIKPRPYYVSDATTADVVACLRRLDDSPGRPIADRLRAMASVGMLQLRTHEFYCAPWSYHRMPDDLVDCFKRASLTVLKGDLNYRRLIGDRDWPATTPFGATTAYFPSPVVCLRTLKSDVIAGLEEAELVPLEASGEPWRSNGRYAIVQANLK